MSVVTTQAAGHEEHAAAGAALARIARMGGLFMASHAVRGAIGLATSIVVARHLGADAFGRWTLCLAWASMLTFVLDLGFGVLLTRDAAADRRVSGALLANAMTARAALFVPVAALFLASAPWLGLAGEQRPVLGAMILLTATGVAYGTIAAMFRAWPEQLAVILALESGGAAAVLAGSWHIARQQGAMRSLLLLAAIVQAAQVVAAAILWRRTLHQGYRWQQPSIRASAALVRRALPFAVTGIVANVQERLGLLMLGRLSGVAELALFGAAWRMGAAARTLPQAALGGGLPVMTDVGTSGPSAIIRARFERWIGTIAAASAAVIVLFAGPLLRVTYGEEFVSAAWSLSWVGVGLWPFVVNSARKVGLYADGREGVAVRFSTITLTIQVVACAVLIPRLGAPGAAAAMAIGEAVVWRPLRYCARARS